MAIYEFPHTRNYEQPIDQLILELTKKVEELEARVAKLESEVHQKWVILISHIQEIMIAISRF